MASVSSQWASCAIARVCICAGPNVQRLSVSRRRVDFDIICREVWSLRQWIALSPAQVVEWCWCLVRSVRRGCRGHWPCEGRGKDAQVSKLTRASASKNNHSTRSARGSWRAARSRSRVIKSAFSLVVRTAMFPMRCIRLSWPYHTMHWVLARVPRDAGAEGVLTIAVDTHRASLVGSGPAKATVGAVWNRSVSVPRLAGRKTSTKMARDI